MADGIRRNNVGTAGIEVEATVEVRVDKVVIRPTGQEFRLSGTAAKGVARRVFR